MTVAANNTLPFRHPDRRRDFRPIKALQHFRKLAANKEQTEHVFHIVSYLRGPFFYRRLRAFWNSPQGQLLLNDPRRLYPSLDDHTALRKLPANSFGRAYLDFMEKEGLTAVGFENEYDKYKDTTDEFEDVLDRFHRRLRDTHDILHILTGYGRDALGEQCILAINFAQNRNIGVGLIAFAGPIEASRSGAKLAPMLKAVREAVRIGNNAANIVHQDLFALLKEPLDEVRKRLNFTHPTAYFEAHEQMRARGIDPLKVLETA
jgi:ubiquinone biosynthesis protein COQ4